MIEFGGGFGSRMGRKKAYETVDMMSKSHQMTSQRRFFSSGDDKALITTFVNLRLSLVSNQYMDHNNMV